MCLLHKDEKQVYGTETAVPQTQCPPPSPKTRRFKQKKSFQQQKEPIWCLPGFSFQPPDLFFGQVSEPSLGVAMAASKATVPWSSAEMPVAYGTAQGGPGNQRSSFWGHAFDWRAGSSETPHVEWCHPTHLWESRQSQHRRAFGAMTKNGNPKWEKGQKVGSLWTREANPGRTRTSNLPLGLIGALVIGFNWGSSKTYFSFTNQLKLGPALACQSDAYPPLSDSARAAGRHGACWAPKAQCKSLQAAD